MKPGRIVSICLAVAVWTPALADSAAPAQPAAPQPGKSYSLDTPEGQAIHQRMMHNYANQQKFQKQQDNAADLQMRTELQTELEGVIHKMADKNTKPEERAELKKKQSLLKARIEQIDKKHKGSKTDL